MIKIKISYTMVFSPCPIEKKQRSLKTGAYGEYLEKPPYDLHA
jgi:hypothetical protein